MFKIRQHILHFNGFPEVLEKFYDANWISDSNDTKSTSGYVFLLGDTLFLENRPRKELSLGAP